MTLLTTFFAAIFSTLLWYTNDKLRELKISSLCFMYWGASIMWFVDAIYEYIELRDLYFTPAPLDMLNDFFLGLSVVAFGLFIWLVQILISDPNGIIHKAIQKQSK